MVTEALMVAGETQDVVDIERSCPEDVTLHANAIAIASDHLQHRFQPHLLDANTRRQAAQTDHGRLVVRDIDGVHDRAHDAGFLLDYFPIGAARGAAFRGHGEVARLKDLLEPARGVRSIVVAHSCETSFTILRGPPSRLGDQSLGSTGCSKRSNWPSSSNRS